MTKRHHAWPRTVRPKYLSSPALAAGVCQFWAAVATLCLVAPAPLAAGPLDLLTGEPGEVVVEPRIDLAPIRHPELAGGLTTTAATSRPAIVLGDRGLLVEPTGLVFSLPSRRIVREVTALWRMELAADVDPRDLEITYELVARSGRRGRLSQPSEPDSEIGIRMRRTGPIEVDDGGGATTVEGGVVLELDLTATRFAGDYAGTLEVTVNPR